MNTLYLECFGGISGDMTVAALIDLGVDKQILKNALNSLHVDGYQIEIGRVKKCGLDACDFNVILDPNLYEKKHAHTHAHAQEHFHEPDHTHEHTPYEHTHHHEAAADGSKLPDPVPAGSHIHRNLTDINIIIDSADLTDYVKNLAKKIFLIVAEAEAKAHGLPIWQVHFHEVGAVDSIIDIVAAAVCLDQLQIKDVIVSELSEGCGQIKCQHGTLPVPVPAVVNIVTSHQLPIHITGTSGELITPTGAAIAAAIRTKPLLPAHFVTKKIGLGAGKRDYEHANILRAMLIEEIPSNSGYSAEEDKIWSLEANLDDCTGEALGAAMEILLQAGAKDVYYTPIYMKKNRPAYLLSVLCADTELAVMERLIFQHTTTIGIRKTLFSRTLMPREVTSIETPYGTAQVKLCRYQGITYCYPEYESVKALAQTCNTDYMSLYHTIRQLAEQTIREES